MYSSVLVPIDLSHVGDMKKALSVAGDLAKSYGAKITYVGVTSNMPTSVAHTPEEFSQKLDEFAANEGASHGRPTAGRAYTSHDPAIELDKILRKAVEEAGADLVVMATHAPGLFEAVHSHHASHLATHTKASIFLVR